MVRVLDPRVHVVETLLRKAAVVAGHPPASASSLSACGSVFDSWPSAVDEGACFEAVSVRQHLHHHDAESVAINFLADVAKLVVDVSPLTPLLPWSYI